MVRMVGFIADACIITTRPFLTASSWLTAGSELRKAILFYAPVGFPAIAIGLTNHDHVWVGSHDAFPAHSRPFSLGVDGIVPAKQVGNEARGAVLATQICVIGGRGTGKPEDIGKVSSLGADARAQRCLAGLELSDQRLTAVLHVEDLRQFVDLLIDIIHALEVVAAAIGVLGVVSHCADSGCEIVANAEAIEVLALGDLAVRTHQDGQLCRNEVGVLG